MEIALVLDDERSAVPIVLVGADDFAAWLGSQPDYVSNWLKASGFQECDGNPALIPSPTGQLHAVLVATDTPQLSTLGWLPQRLPSGEYRLDLEAIPGCSEEMVYLLLLGFLLGGYRFDRYKQSGADVDRTITLLFESADLITALNNEIAAISLVRDLINTPAEDMMPQDLFDQTKTLAKSFEAEVKEIVGEQLLAENYPMIYAVGRASQHPPRLIELHWGDPKAPHIVLVGKGVCFDTGGLNLKPTGGMRLMKKDMGGAACVLGLAQLIMSNALPVQLTVLISAVENSVSGNSYRPGDVFMTRQGDSVEIDNTDAEGRLVLADALTYACEKSPNLIVDYATLTGAARVALGTEVAAMFTPDDRVAAGLSEASQSVQDPLWRLPLHQPYQAMLKSDIADTLNSVESPYAGSIIAALFLSRFVADDIPWVHYDVMAWNNSARAAAPPGGEAMAVRATYRFLAQQYSQ